MSIKENIKQIIENIIDYNLDDNFENIALLEDLKFSSLELLILIINIEEEYKINLENEIYYIRTIGELIQKINNLS